MEGVVLEIRDIIQQWFDRGMDVQTLRIGGGATRSALWNQIQADVYGKPVQTLGVGESTGLGAAVLGGLGAGVFSSLEEGVAAMVKVSGQIEPDPARHQRYEEMYDAYVNAYEGLTSSGTFDLLSRIQASD
jgi:xylulokinase